MRNRIEIIHGAKKLVVGSIGGIKIWNFKLVQNRKMGTRRNEFDGIDMEIDLMSQEWVNVLYVCEETITLYTGCENNLYVRLLKNKITTRHTII